MKILLLILALLPLTAGATPWPDGHNLLPLPREAEFTGETVTLSSVTIDMPAWQDAWEEALGGLGVKVAGQTRYHIEGHLTDHIAGTEDNDEAYTLTVAAGRTTVTATSPKGLYWALQTFVQLAGKGRKGRTSLPCCRITDRPAFRVRGLMMDAGRSHISPEELKRVIDRMSRFKMNVFHLHLTDNQAWRLESRLFPMLNDSANMTRQPGLYYTVGEISELIAFARSRNVTIIPEIDMPGHSAAFRRTFRHDMQSPEGMKILKLLVEEACEVFADVPYLHIGTDEVEFTNPSFVPEMVEFVRSKGKQVISWNPGWAYRPGEIDMTQLWSTRGKAQPGIPAVDSRLHYINHFDLYADLVALYRSRIYDRDKGSDDIAGVELALWTDRYVADEASCMAQNNLYPSIMAVAERSWMGGGTEYFDSLGTNMGAAGSRDFLDFADFERRMLHHKETTLKDVFIPYVRQTDVRWRITDAFPNGGDLTRTFPPETEGLRDSYTYEGKVYRTRTATGAGIYLRHVWGPETVPAFYEDPQPDHTAYAYTRVYSPREQTVGLQAETQNYSRSESDIPPPAGKWDWRESVILLNGEAVAPPVWLSGHTVRDNELTLTNENAAARPPLPVRLRKGWNTVMLKLPVGQFTTPRTRLVKWMFTFVFTTPDGRDAAPGLIYSPNPADDPSPAADRMSE